ncbi:AbgT family transporter [Roseomonas gilardii subsp. gilardii]|uniref:AbgT family transporter n=1 Tax=Roseomonas gilardii TaxID=257708 RepID=UPI001FF83FBD|nr:AbgT family transporter [Roseomonas gilardii]UPG73727.1 AbgT family transporter [Roseomonas gilardii subsp. gilardii]
MHQSEEGISPEAPRSAMQSFLDVVERIGNRVPNPIVLFLILIAIVVVLSHLLDMAGVSVTYLVINPGTNDVESTTTAVRSLLRADGIRFMVERMIPIFLGFTALGQLFVAMLGVGVAEEAGLVDAMIRKVVRVAPYWALCYILVFVGIVSSIASNAGYLVLIPLAAVAFLKVGRHPIAGLAAGFAAVGGAFSVNMFIKPIDAVLAEMTNDAIRLIDPSVSIGLASNIWFSIASTLFLTVVVTLITERIIEPRLGAYGGTLLPEGEGAAAATEETAPANEARGLRFALVALAAVALLFGLLTFPPGAALRDPATGAIIGNTPFMNGLVVIIAVVFLACGAAYGIGARTMNGIGDVIKAMQKTVTGLSGMMLVMFFISQFVAYFNYSNIATILAISMSDVLQTTQIGPFWLLIGFILVICVLDLFITGAVAKWAMLAPIFVPLLMRLGVPPEAVLAGYRIGDSVPNIATPMLSMYALILGFFQRYDRSAGVGTVLTLMLPYVMWMLVTWLGLFTLWYWLGIPWGV